MNDRPVSWEHWRSFLAVFQAGSLSGAAHRLGLTQPTVGRHIDALEEQLGTTLFVRSRYGLSPTERALDLAPHAQAMAAASDALVRAATGAGAEASGVVRLTASTVVGAEVLPPVLARFHDAHPAIAVELVLSNRTDDLLKREADIAVRMVRPAQAALIARKIGDTPVGFFAHRAYAERRGLPAALDDLDGHALIGPDRDMHVLAPLETRGVKLTRGDFAFRTDSQLAQHALLRAGAGIGGMQKRLAGRDSDLISVLPEILEIPLEMWLVMHEDLRATRRVRLLYDHLAKELSAHLAAT